jgi:hypothetical protein
VTDCPRQRGSHSPALNLPAHKRLVADLQAVGASCWHLSRKSDASSSAISRTGENSLATGALVSGPADVEALIDGWQLDT